MYFLPVIVGKSSVISNKNVQDVWCYQFLYVLLPMKSREGYERYRYRPGGRPFNVSHIRNQGDTGRKDGVSA